MASCDGSGLGKTMIIPQNLYMLSHRAATTSNCKTPGLTLSAGKASEGSRCSRKSTDARTKKAWIIRLAKSVRHARSGRIGGVQLNPPAALLTAVASYEPDQWGALLAAAADREKLEDTWEEWNAGAEKLIRELEKRGIPWVRVPLDVEEINQFCEEEGIPNDGAARANLAARKAQQNAQ